MPAPLDIKGYRKLAVPLTKIQNTIAYITFIWYNK